MIHFLENGNCIKLLLQLYFQNNVPVKPFFSLCKKTLQIIECLIIEKSLVPCYTFCQSGFCCLLGLILFLKIVDAMLCITFLIKVVLQAVNCWSIGHSVGGAALENTAHTNDATPVGVYPGALNKLSQYACLGDFLGPSEKPTKSQLKARAFSNGIYRFCTQACGLSHPQLSQSLPHPPAF